jgi:hypothetical protein
MKDIGLGLEAAADSAREIHGADASQAAGTGRAARP